MIRPPMIEGPVPSTATSRPFLTAAAALESAGYVEHEYFLSGQASAYDWIGARRDVETVAGPAAYRTRLLVWRPRDPRAFSGNLEMMLLNSSQGYDWGGPIDPDALVRRGDAWIGLTSKPVAANALQRWDGERYASLSWPNPAPPARRCAHPSIIPVYTFGADSLGVLKGMGHRFSAPETEDGLIWDMLAQLGRLLKSDARDAILPGFARPCVYLTGFSQSAQYLRTWLTAFHATCRAPDGSALYDGYLAIAGPVQIRLNQCSADVLPDDPRQILPPTDARFISLCSEGEMWLARHTRQPDQVSPDRGIVSYEVAGAAHIDFDLATLAPSPFLPSTPATADMEAIPGMRLIDAMNSVVPPGLGLNTLPWKPLARGAVVNLQRWMREGRSPPQGAPIATDRDGNVRRDADDNALGGIRLPYIGVPLYTFRGAISDGGVGSVTGWRKRFARERIASLYPTRAAYLEQFSREVARLRAEGWISAGDADAMRQAAGPEFDALG